MTQRSHNSFHGYTAPPRYAPQWYVANLVFKGGNPCLKTASLTGGGQVYGHEFRGGNDPNLNQIYSPGVSSPVGGGQINARPAFLTSLIGAVFGTGPIG